MSNYLPYSTKLAKTIVKNANLPEEKEEIIAYSIEVFSLNLLNISLTVIIGYLLGVLQGALICLIVLSAVRLFAGGAHSASPWICTSITALLFPLMAFIASKLSVILSTLSIDIILIGSLVITYTALFTLAPVDNEAAPIISPDRRRKLKNTSIKIFTLFVVLAVIARFSQYNASEALLCLSITSLWISFILTPIGHNFFNGIDRMWKIK